MTVTALLGTLGSVGIGVALVVIGLLSKRLGASTHARSYYVGFYIAAALVGISVLARLLNLLFGLAQIEEVYQNPLWIFLYTALPAIALTLGVVSAWRYWSWLLAERD
jgi:hypothetical protein